MTQVLDPGAIRQTSPGHYISEFFGLGAVNVASFIHRERAGLWATHPTMTDPVGATFISRACAVEWEHPSGREHLGLLAYAEPPTPKGGPRTAPDGAPLGGSWLPDGNEYDRGGHSRPAMEEDDDRTPAPHRPGKSPNWHLGLALVALAGLVIVACCMTDGGGFE